MSDAERLIAMREHTHGSFSANAAIAQALKLVMSQAPNFEQLDHTKVEALERIAMKLARILCGDADEADHWRDIGGYCELVLQELRGRTRGGGSDGA